MLNVFACARRSVWRSVHDSRSGGAASIETNALPISAMCHDFGSDQDGTFDVYSSHCKRSGTHRHVGVSQRRYGRHLTSTTRQMASDPKIFAATVGSESLPGDTLLMTSRRRRFCLNTLSRSRNPKSSVKRDDSASKETVTYSSTAVLL